MQKKGGCLILFCCCLFIQNCRNDISIRCFAGYSKPIPIQLKDEVVYLGQSIDSFMDSMYLDLNSYPLMTTGGRVKARDKMYILGADTIDCKKMYYFYRDTLFRFKAIIFIDTFHQNKLSENEIIKFLIPNKGTELKPDSVYNGNGYTYYYHKYSDKSLDFSACLNIDSSCYILNDLRKW